MADEHFWDNGVSDISTEENCKLVFETITGKNIENATEDSFNSVFETIKGEKKTTPMMTIDKTLKLMDVLKNGRQTVSCEAIKVVDGEEQSIQSFKLNVIEVDGEKIII